MALAYVSPQKMDDYRQQLLLFAKGAPTLDCIRSHFLPDRSGNCDLTGQKEQDEIFVLANRAHSTLKVGSQGMQIVANVLDILNTNEWFEHLKAQKKQYRERLLGEALKKEEERKAASKTVVLRRKNPQTLFKSSNS